MKMLKIVLAVFLALRCSVVFSQVGTVNNQPHKSAALDLSGANKGGLLIPRLSLSTTTDVSSIAGGVPAQSLLVFNTNASITGSGSGGAGYYYWDTNIWKKLASAAGSNNNWSLTGNGGTAPGTNFLGTTEGTDLVFKTSSTEKMRVVNSSGNVGIGTVNPAYKLEVAGTTKVSNKLYLGTAATAPTTINISPVVRSTTTGEVYKVGTAASSFVYNYITYTLENVNSASVTNFDTKIPTATYTVAVVGSSFWSSSYANRLVVKPGYPGSSFIPQNVNAFQSGGTWRLAAYYPGGLTLDGVNGTWTLYLLVINNSVINNLGQLDLDLGGNSGGDFPSKPAGL